MGKRRQALVDDLKHKRRRRVDIGIDITTFRSYKGKLNVKSAVQMNSIEMTPVPEGSLIRAIRRLEEVPRQLIEPEKSIGETDLEAKFEDDVNKIKREIVFAASKVK
ncbi:UNVERIFIED_CONTAM: DExH-box ATP-dependent RNA helicase DExH9 [Sesamum calycinum]|uniref:DExH-box ATP-dependent RNA helicase DExH9 n=1 Tax=Sesamum calycinum TaxID=2727403 RepID=A0AAW2R8J3_9LAMI